MKDEIPNWAMPLIERLARVEARLARIEARSDDGTFDTKGAMARLGYKSAKRFWEAVRRLGIPYSRLSVRHAVFRTSDIDAALARRRIGNSPARRW